MRVQRYNDLSAESGGSIIVGHPGGHCVRSPVSDVQLIANVAGRTQKVEFQLGDAFKALGAIQ